MNLKDCEFICETPPQPVEQTQDELTGWETIVFELDDEAIDE